MSFVAEQPFRKAKFTAIFPALFSSRALSRTDQIVASCLQPRENAMLTAIDAFLGFAGLVTVASLWNMFGGDMFPAEKDPTGGE